MATSVPARSWWAGTAATIVADAAFALGAIALAGEAAVHIQQYGAVVQGARIAPLFIANAVACIAVIAALAYRPTRPLAALAGIVISALALASLVVSYGREGGLFGWVEGGFRTAIVLAVVTELAAVVLLATALAVTTGLVQARSGPRPAARQGALDGGDDEVSPRSQLTSVRAGDTGMA